MAGASLAFVFLDISHEEAARRIAARRHHYMPPSLLDSQFATLERPQGERDVVTIDRLASTEGVVAEAARALSAQSDAEGDGTISPLPARLSI